MGSEDSFGATNFCSLFANCEGFATVACRLVEVVKQRLYARESDIKNTRADMATHNEGDFLRKDVAMRGWGLAGR